MSSVNLAFLDSMIFTSYSIFMEYSIVDVIVWLRLTLINYNFNSSKVHPVFSGAMDKAIILIGYPDSMIIGQLTT